MEDIMNANEDPLMPTRIGTIQDRLMDYFNIPTHCYKYSWLIENPRTPAYIHYQTNASARTQVCTVEENGTCLIPARIVIHF